MAIEITNISPEPNPQIVENNSLPVSGVIFDATDPRGEQLSKEERIKMYYARELAAGNLNALTPRYRTSEYGNSDDPYQDFLVADPLSDPQVSELASVLKASGYKPIDEE